MEIEQQEKRGPGRPPKSARGEEMTQQRRRRNTSALSGKRRRLFLNTESLDPNFEYRWVNTEPGRVEVLTMQDDWEVVEDRNGEIKNDVIGDGTKVSIVAGAGASGTPVQAVLLRKLKKYQDEDRQAQQRRIDEKENDIRRGAAPAEGGASGDKFYASQEGIRIETGSRS